MDLRVAAPARPAIGRAGAVPPGTVTPLLGDGDARGHGKSELGAAAGRVRHRDVAVHRLDEALHDVQAKAGPATALAAPELAEYPDGHLRRYALALIAHGHGDGFALITVHPRALYHDRNDTSPVPDRVFHEVAEDLVDLVGIQPGLRQVGRRVQPEPVFRLAGGDPASDDLAGPLGDVDELAPHLHPAGLDAGDVEQLGDQPGHPVG